MEMTHKYAAADMILGPFHRLKKNVINIINANMIEGMSRRISTLKYL